MADFIQADSQHRVARQDPAAAHQIRLLRPHGARSRGIVVGCTCSAPVLQTVDGASDHWVWFNRLAHDVTRGPFTPVDPLSGRPAPGQAAPEMAPVTVREWAAAAGFPIAVTGRIPNAILAEYAIAHSTGSGVSLQS